MSDRRSDYNEARISYEILADSKITGGNFTILDRRSDYSEARISQEILADSKITGGNFTILDRDVRLKRS